MSNFIRTDVKLQAVATEDDWTVYRAVEYLTGNNLRQFFLARETGESPPFRPEPTNGKVRHDRNFCYV